MARRMVRDLGDEVMLLRTEEAYDFLVDHLATIPADVRRDVLPATRYAHTYLPDLVVRFWQARGSTISFGDLTDEHFRPFYDAAWELARIGVIRPGRVAPKGQEHPTDFGDHWSITEFGFQWLADASKRSYLDMGRLSEIFTSFTGRFGLGFAQRAVEAVRSYRTGSYLSACAMVGAAAESILLAVAIAKKSDEAAILKMYSGSGGRHRVTSYVTGQSTASVQQQFQAALRILHYWRDDASHGVHTTISEVEAHAALSELIRLAQFVSDNWDGLTA
jgi:hypothetical protein